MPTDSINLNFLVTNRVTDWPESLNKFNVIYKITNIINGKSYIGKTSSFRKRFHQGYVKFINNPKLYGNKLRSYLFNAFKSYGLDNFEVSILEYDIDPTELNKKEIEYISKYNTFLCDGYNMTKGGDSPSPNWSSSGRSVLLDKYPETNGVPKETILARQLAGLTARKLKYPDTNGTPTEFIQAGISGARWAHINRSYKSLLSMCIKAKSEGLLKFNGKAEYMRYKIDYSPAYAAAPMNRVIGSAREFGFDLELISEFIRKDWLN